MNEIEHSEMVEPVHKPTAAPTMAATTPVATQAPTTPVATQAPTTPVATKQIPDPACQDVDPNCVPQLQKHYCHNVTLVKNMCKRTCNMCPMVTVPVDAEVTTKAPQKRGFDLLGALGKVTDGTKMGTALKVINAFSKVHSLLDDIKNLAPELHKALNSSIADIEHAFGSIIDDIGAAIGPEHKSKRDLGFGMNMFGAFSLVEALINDIQTMSPPMVIIMGDSIAEVEQAFEEIMDEIEHSEMVEPVHKPTAAPTTAV